MSTEREEREGLANDIYEHSRLRSAEADGLAFTLSRLGYRKQEPVSDEDVERARVTYLVAYDVEGKRHKEALRAVLVAARAVTNGDNR